MESPAALVVARIAAEHSLSSVGPADRDLLCFFFALQFLRVPAQRAVLKRINAQLRDFVRRSGQDPDSEGLSELTSDEIQRESLALFENTDEIAQTFHEKDWMLLRLRAGTGLFISDNPISLFHQEEAGPRGRLGLSVPGIQIYMPLTQQLSLAMLCPSHLPTMAKRYSAGAAGAQFGPAFQESAQIAIRTLGNGGTLPVGSFTGDFLNGLQVRGSTRFLYSAVANFDLAREAPPASI